MLTLIAKMKICTYEYDQIPLFIPLGNTIEVEAMRAKNMIIFQYE